MNWYNIDMMDLLKWAGRGFGGRCGTGGGFTGTSISL
jgi:hypothetical protein